LYKKFVKNKIKFIFIFHNFIPAFSSAFAYAEPDKRNVLIEVLWGLPEGLYYYSHDKYIVDTQHPQIDMINKDDFTIQKKINPKNNFVCPDNNGKWVVNAVSPQYIWKQAITQESYLRDIACQTRKITEHLKKSTSVMWFIGVNEKENKCRVFPWYHEEIIFDDIPKQLNRRKNIYETHFAVKTNEDFYKLQQLISEGNNIKYITYQPIEEKMLRDKDTIKAIGELAKSANATITLEGGILSHAYYQLKRTGVAVEVKEVFHTKKNSIEYNKLVRDEIPKKIENHGEVAVTKELSRDELLQQLKIKMVEEALEVFDSKTKDEIIQELADVAEIFDSIIKRINTNKKEVMSIQKTKRDKVGGFEKGILLRHTENPVYKNIRPNNLSDEQKERKEYFWTDSTEKKGYIKHINIPISLKSFSTNILINDFKTDAKILIHIEGQRENGVMHLDFSVKNETEQSLFKGNE
jgi:predicted house-cleaning noncanonical NTP pyrophosphatase (MazG superfamily)